VAYDDIETLVSSGFVMNFRVGDDYSLDGFNLDYVRVETTTSSIIVFEDNFDTLNTDVWEWGPPEGNPYAMGGVLHFPSVAVSGGGGRGYAEFKTKTSVVPDRITATVDVDPDKLNMKSNGEWVTAYLTLPEGYSVNDVDASTLTLNSVPIDWWEIIDGVLMCKFNRRQVKLNAFALEPDYEGGDKFYEVALRLEGNLVDGTIIEGTDLITVIMQ
jgi:hypothetical protein